MVSQCKNFLQHFMQIFCLPFPRNPSTKQWKCDEQESSGRAFKNNNNEGVRRGGRGDIARGHTPQPVCPFRGGLGSRRESWCVCVRGGGWVCWCQTHPGTDTGKWVEMEAARRSTTSPAVIQTLISEAGENNANVQSSCATTRPSGSGFSTVCPTFTVT